MASTRPPNSRPPATERSPRVRSLGRGIELWDCVRSSRGSGRSARATTVRTVRTTSRAPSGTPSHRGSTRADRRRRVVSPAANGSERSPTSSRGRKRKRTSRSGGSSSWIFVSLRNRETNYMRNSGADAERWLCSAASMATRCDGRRPEQRLFYERFSSSEAAKPPRAVRAGAARPPAESGAPQAHPMKKVLGCL